MHNQGTRDKSDNQLLKEFKNVLNQVGHDIAALKYDALTIPHPARRTLQERFSCGWLELKAMVFPEMSDPTYQALINQNKALHEKNRQLADLRQGFIETTLVALSKISFSPLSIPPKIKSKEMLEFHSIRSDAQVGELLEKEEVQGINEYNSDIYNKRVQKWTKKVLKFKEQDEASLGLNKLVVHHVGDQVEGERIYRGQAFHLDLNLIEQLFFSLEVEASSMLTLAQKFNEIEIFCVPGNHGRPGKVGEHHSKTNFDYLFYRMLKMQLEKQPNIKVFVSESPTMIVKHGKKNFILTHGENIKAYMGIPYYGLEREHRKLADLYGMVFDYQISGHFHQPARLGDKIILNGSIVGGSAFSVNKMGLASAPSQKIFYFHGEKGINRESDLFLGEPISLSPDQDGIYTPHV